MFPSTARLLYYIIVTTERVETKPRLYNIYIISASRQRTFKHNYLNGGSRLAVEYFLFTYKQFYVMYISNNVRLCDQSMIIY